MFQLLLLLFVCSPIIAVISIAVAVSNSNWAKRLEKENSDLINYIKLYKRKYGKLNEDEISELGIDSELEIKTNNDYVDNDVVDKLEVENTIDNQNNGNKTIQVEQFDDNVENCEALGDSNDNISISSILADYIDKNNISQGNLLFALGTLFISIAGIVFATTTWNIIPNVFKIIILLMVAIVAKFLSFFSKNKFKLIKTSITLNVIFCILISLIPLSMGYFHMLGSYLIVGGKGQFLLYAISLLVFIVLFARFSTEYNLDKLSSYLLYIINIELILIVLNFTNRFDLVMLILSIYNLVLMIISNFTNFDNVSFVFFKRIKEISNQTLLLLSTICIFNTSQSILFTILSILFSIMYINEKIDLNVENKSFYKYIIASMFLIASCIRFNIVYDFRLTSEYFTLLIIVLSILFVGYKRIDDKNFVYMIYIITASLFLSFCKDFIRFDITIQYLISMLVNVIAIVVLCIKSNEKIFKYLKTIYFIIFVLSISRYLYISYNIETLSSLIIFVILLFGGYIISNLIDKKYFKNKLINTNINIAYSVLILTCLIIMSAMLKFENDYFKRIIVYNILILLSCVVNYLNRIYDRDNNNLILWNLFSNIILFISNCYIITLNPFGAIIVFAMMLYDYIIYKYNKHQYILTLSFLLYVNLLSYRVLVDYRMIILLCLLVLFYIALYIIDYKGINKVDLRFAEICIITNLVFISIIEYSYYGNNINVVLISILFNLFVSFLYYKRENYIALPFVFLVYNNMLSYIVLSQYRIIILLLALILYFVFSNIIAYKKVRRIDLFSVDFTVVINLIIAYLNETIYYYDIMNSIIIILVFNIVMVYFYFNRNTAYKRKIEIVIQISMLILISLIYKYLTHESVWFDFLYVLPVMYMNGSFCFWYYIVCMIISIIRLFIINDNDFDNYKHYSILCNIGGITKHCITVSLILCISKIVFNSLNNLDILSFDLNYYILTLFFSLYLIAILIKLRITNGLLKSKNINIIIIAQMITLQLLFIHLIKEGLLIFYNRFEILRDIRSFSLCFNIVYYFIILNFIIYMLTKQFINRQCSDSTIYKVNKIADFIQNDNWSFDLIITTIKKIYDFAIGLIIDVCGVLLVVSLILNSYQISINSLSIRSVNYSYLVFVRYLLLTLILNIYTNGINEKKFTRILMFLIPYTSVYSLCLLTMLIFKNNIIYFDYLKYIIISIIFIVYYILSFIIKNKSCRIKINSISVSYFSIANISMLLYFNDIIIYLSNNSLKEQMTMMYLLFIGLFILQFKTENISINKFIYTMSLFLITVSLLIQNIIVLSNFSLEYYLVIIGLSLFVLDKLIWKFVAIKSKYLCLVYQIVAFGVLFLKVFINNLIVNTVLFGIIMLSTLLVSFIKKKYYNFVITLIYMILTAIYVTRNIWFSIAWWAYLLIVGIILILFATKNEQLKKENKNFSILLNEISKKFKDRFE